MKPTLTGKAYDEITHLWAEASFNNDNGIRQLERALTFIDARGAALDVGCGCSSRFLECLRSKGFRYEGLDVSTEMINVIRKHHPDIVFYYEDICEWKIPKTYSLITAWDSLWHVPIEKHEQVITRLVSALKPNGVLIFSFGGLEKANEHTNRLMGPKVYYSTLGTSAYLCLMEKIGCISRHLEYDQYPDTHAYIIAQKAA